MGENYKIIRGNLTTLIETPGAVDPLSATVSSGSWQTTSQVEFFWSIPDIETIPLQDYLWTLSQTPGLTADSGWNTTTDTSVEVDLSQPPYGSGVWYFYVAARNIGGYIGPTSSFEVWYNHAPTAPGQTYMKVDEQDTLDLDAPPLTKYGDPNVLEWSPGSDQDFNDSELSYEIQVCSQQNFIQDNPNVVLITLPLAQTNSTTLSDKPNPGIYFWRIRSYDGKQSSSWSQVGSFRWNTPPNPPTGLVASAAS